MASTTYPLIQQGSFTVPAAFTGAAFTHVSHAKRVSPVDVTGSRLVSGAFAQDKAKEWRQELPIEEFIADGHVEKSKAYALAQLSTLAFSGAGLLIHVRQWRLHKHWPLVDVTNGSEKEWTWGIPVYSLQARGWAKSATGPVTGTLTDTVTLTVDQVGTIAWATGTTKIWALDSIQTDAPLGVGGGVPVAVSGLMQGAVTYTPGTNTFAWLFINPASVADDPLKLTCILDTDAESISHSALLYDHTFDCPSVTGGPIGYTCRMRFDKAAA